MERATIALTDQTPGDPITHLFKPNGEDKNGVHLFENRDNGIPIGNERLTISVVAPMDRSRGLYVVTAKLWLPTLETVSASTSSGLVPAPTLAYNTSAEIVFKCPARGLKYARSRARELVIALLQHEVVIAAVDELEDIW